MACLLVGSFASETIIPVPKHEVLVHKDHKLNPNLANFLADQKEERKDRIIDAKQDNRAENIRDLIKAKDAVRRARENKEINIEQHLRAIKIKQDERERKHNNHKLDSHQRHLRDAYMRDLHILHKKLRAEYMKERRGLRMRRHANRKTSIIKDHKYKHQLADRHERAIENKDESLDRKGEVAHQGHLANKRQAHNKFASIHRERSVRRNNARQHSLRRRYAIQLAREAKALEHFYRHEAKEAIERKIDNKEESKAINHEYKEQNIEERIRAGHIKREMIGRKHENAKISHNTDIRDHKVEHMLHHEHRAQAINDKKQKHKRNFFEKDLRELRRQLKHMYGKQRKEQHERAHENAAEHREAEKDNKQRDFENKLIAINKAKRENNDKVVAKIDRINETHIDKNIKVMQNQNEKIAIGDAL